MSATGKEGTGKRDGDSRKERLAASLRANLQKRKVLQRQRQSQFGEEEKTSDESTVQADP
ncbi:hypothetical protein MnTg02_01469 [bacterium MnTg02]|nr:hypothetical protein MnTg02_01469 [bacterium MnTg02]